MTRPIFFSAFFLLNPFSSTLLQPTFSSVNVVAYVGVETIQQRFPSEPGYTRLPVEAGSYGEYLRTLPLKPVGSEVKNYDGTLSNMNGYAAAVIDISVGNRDLQQCADAVMRLRSEYLFAKKQYDHIYFYNWGGLKMDWTRYKQGYRFRNNKFVKTAQPDGSAKTFTSYLEFVFAYASTVTLEKQLQAVNDMKKMQPGDVLIKGGTPGHCFIVIDVAENKTGSEKQFMIAESFMPAQNIHLLKNDRGGVWFTVGKQYNIPFANLLDNKHHRRFDSSTN